LQVPSNSKKDTLRHIKDLLLSRPGKIRVILKIGNNEDAKTIDTKLSVNDDDNLRNELASIVGKENIFSN